MFKILKKTSNYVKINPRWLSFGIFMPPPLLKFILYSRHWTLNKFHQLSPKMTLGKFILSTHWAVKREQKIKTIKKVQKKLRINFVANRLHVHSRHSIVCMSEIKARKKFKLLCSHLDLFSEKDYKALFFSLMLHLFATILESTKVTMSCIYVVTEWEWALCSIFF